MENILTLKAQKPIKGWMIAVIISAFVLIASGVTFVIAFNTAVAGQYTTGDIWMSVLGAFMDTMSVVVFLGLIFMIVAVAGKKNSRFFVKFMLWAMMLLTLYYVSPNVQLLYQIFAYGSTITFVQLLYYLSMILPQLIFAALLVSYILQMDSQNKKITNTISWISFLVSIVLLAGKLIYIVQQTQTLLASGGAVSETVLNIAYFAIGAFSVLFIIFFSMMLYKATEVAGEGKKKKEKVLDDAIEKIAGDGSNGYTEEMIAEENDAIKEDDVIEEDDDANVKED